MENPDEFVIQFLKPDTGKSSQVTVPSIKDSSMFMTTMNIYFGGPDEDSYHGYVYDDYAMLVIPTFASSEIESDDYKTYLEEFFTELK